MERKGKIVIGGDSQELMESLLWDKAIMIRVEGEGILSHVCPFLSS